VTDDVTGVQVADAAEMPRLIAGFTALMNARGGTFEILSYDEYECRYRYVPDQSDTQQDLSNPTDDAVSISDPEPIAGDDFLVDAWVYGDDPQHRIICEITRGDAVFTQYHFTLHPEQAIELAHDLLTLARSWVRVTGLSTEGE
jgi:hypothetical protein